MLGGAKFTGKSCDLEKSTAQLAMLTGTCRASRRSWQAQRPSSGQRQPSGIGDPHPDNLDRPLASMHGLGRRRRQPFVHEVDQHPAREAMRQPRWPRSAQRRADETPGASLDFSRMASARRAGSPSSGTMDAWGHRKAPDRWKSLPRWLSLAGPGDLGLADRAGGNGHVS
jgi:hypothetical protein